MPTLITGTLPKAALVFNENTARPAKGGGSKKGSVASEIQLDPVIRSEFSSDDIDRIEDELGNTLEGSRVIYCYHFQRLSFCDLIRNDVYVVCCVRSMLCT